MPRKKTKDFDRQIQPDEKYESVLVSKLINALMLQGKKNAARKIVYSSLEKAAAQTKSDDVIKMLEQILENIKPVLEVKSRRVGGANYQVPVEVREKRRISLAFKWIVQSTRKRSGKTTVENLTAELTDAFNNQGGAVKKREDMHRMAEANKAFAHLNW